MKKVMISIVAIVCTTVAVLAANELKKQECNPDKPGCTCPHMAKTQTATKAGTVCVPGCVCSK